MKFVLTSAYITFSINKVLYKNKFQKTSVINYLALHKNLWRWIQKHIWTIYPIKTELQFHFISMTILLEDTNAPTHKILCHRYISTCGKPEPINISWGFPNVSHMWKKMTDDFKWKKKKKKHMTWFLLRADLMNDTHSDTGHDVKWNSPHHDSCFTDILISRMNRF